MRTWVVFLLLFMVFFGTAELYPWLMDWATSTPGFLAAGLLLAIASNLNTWKRPTFNQPKKPAPSPSSTTPTPTATTSTSPTHPTHPPLRPTPLPSSPPPNRPISFTIKKPNSHPQP